MRWAPPPHPYKYQKYIREMEKPNKVVQLSSCPANFTLVIMETLNKMKATTMHLSQSLQSLECHISLYLALFQQA